MHYEILLSREAVEDLRSVQASVRGAIEVALGVHLRHEPEKLSRSRSKRLRGLTHPQYRLRVGEFRVFYDVSAVAVEVLAVIAKSEAEAWLTQFGNLE